MNKLDQFEHKMKLNTNLSKSSIHNYMRALAWFYEEYDEFNQDNIEKFVSSLVDDFGNGYINIVINGFRKYKFLFNYDFELPSCLKTEQPVREIILEDQLPDIYHACDWIFNKAYKIKAIIGLLFYTGLRPSELCNLKREAFDLNQKTVLIERTKNYKARVVYYPSEIRQRLSNYFNLEAEETNAFNIKTNTAQIYCIKISKQSNIHVSPKILRHSCATMLVEKGFDIFTIKEILGHKKIETTMIYAQKSDRRIKAEYFEKINNKYL